MNIKIILAIIILWLSNFEAKAQSPSIFICKNGTISFFSETPLENIDATSNTLGAIINTTTKEVNFMVDIKSFKFKKPLMQEHFNEKYMESDKYPVAVFKGKINDTIDWNKDGTYNVAATGVLTIHNTPKSYTENATITIKNNTITIEGAFNIKVADHNIEVPTLVVSKVAEVVNVKHKSVMVPYIPQKK